MIKVKSMATQEIGLDAALEHAGVAAVETDLAELIVQLGHDRPSHILVPAIHRNRREIRDIFLREMPDTDESLTSEPADLAEAARRHLREKFLSTKVAISGANFGVAETGTLSVVESEGNGRMCLTLPETLITVMGIEKLVPTFEDLEVFLQLLPRSSTGERMNPYTSMWTGVTEGDGPQEFHLVLLDNGRSAVLSDPKGRSALHCIRCSACMNVCPVYEQTGGHAYGSVYPGPIGAILSPQLTGVDAGENGTLPYASTLCGACYDVCPVAIDIPSILIHLRDEDVQATHAARKALRTEKDAAGGPLHHMHAGSIATMLAPGDAEVMALLERISAVTTISYDPNVRPTIVPDRAFARARAEESVRLADVVHASDEDIAWLYPDRPLRESLQAWQQMGPAFVVMTRGAEDIVAVTAHGVVERPIVPVDVADTVGAGDSFTAALLAALDDRSLLGAANRGRLHAMDPADVESVLIYASRASAITASRPGADPPTRAELAD